jgi:uncharacterized protein (TIGR02001 family)
MKNSIVLATAVASVLTSGIAAAELTANAAIASNYIWRGITQTQNQAAGQGGIDWGHDSGFYVGTWLSNVDFTPVGQKGYEMDVYAGFGGEAGGLGYDLGVITYQYPMEPNINFTELYVSGTMSIVTIGVNYTVDAGAANKDAAFDSGDMYVSGSLNFPVSKSDVSLYVGSYMFDADGTGAGKAGDINYSHYGASISKDGFTFAVDKNDADAATNPVFGSPTSENVRFTASYSVDFAL